MHVLTLIFICLLLKVDVDLLRQKYFTKFEHHKMVNH